MKGKKLIAVVLIGLLLISCTACKSEAEKEADQAKENWEQTTNEGRMSIYCALIKEYMLLVEDFGENTPYPAMKRSVKGNMMSGGMTQEEAIANAKEVIVKEQAIFWYGEQAGISATDEEVAAYIQENVLAEIQASDDYETVDAACAKEGITFEDTVWAYEDSYKMQYILIQSGVESDKEVAFVEDIIEDYRETDEYAALAEVLENCGQLIAAGVTDKDTIRDSAIYVQ